MSSNQLGLAAARPYGHAQAPQQATSFDELGLTPDLLRTVAAQGYVEPTPVQAQSIPIVLSGRDILAGAQTGTGKTAAFVLPILQLLDASRPAPQHLPPGRLRPRGSTGLPIRCLVLTPTRELALQIEQSVRTYSAARPVRSATIYGGVGFQPQVHALRGGPEIVVATPGRLLDHSGQGTIDLGLVEILVLDEADRMLDMGFIRDIRRIISLLPARRQNLLFSATFSDDIRELAAGLLHDPAYVQIARNNAPIELVRQVVYPVDRERKRELLSHLVSSGRIDRALVFTRTKHGADRLAQQLGHDGILAAAIHGNKSQGQRVRALDDFKAGKIPVLVATEVASRGLDIDGLPHVVNFELPTVPADYVHRIGRTGRAGMEGDAVSLVCIDENLLLGDIEALLRQRIAAKSWPASRSTRRSAASPFACAAARFDPPPVGVPRLARRSPPSSARRPRTHPARRPRTQPATRLRTQRVRSLSATRVRQPAAASTRQCPSSLVAHHRPPTAALCRATSAGPFRARRRSGTRRLDGPEVTQPRPRDAARNSVRRRGPATGPRPPDRPAAATALTTAANSTLCRASELPDPAAARADLSSPRPARPTDRFGGSLSR